MNTSGSASIKAQLSRHSVALVSIFIALLSLGYNTWRNEHTEYNRNLRVASFELLAKLSQLKELVYLGHYDKDMQKGNPRTGWSYVLTIQDLSMVLPSALQKDTDTLNNIWSDNWEGIGSNDQSVELIDAEIDRTRDDTIKLIQSLH